MDLGMTQPLPTLEVLKSGAGGPDTDDWSRRAG